MCVGLMSHPKTSICSCDAAALLLLLLLLLLPSREPTLPNKAIHFLL
jgi:hypothetical protein